MGRKRSGTNHNGRGGYGAMVFAQCPRCKLKKRCGRWQIDMDALECINREKCDARRVRWLKSQQGKAPVRGPLVTFPLTDAEVSLWRIKLAGGADMSEVEKATVAGELLEELRRLTRILSKLEDDLESETLTDLRRLVKTGLRRNVIPTPGFE